MPALAPQVTEKFIDSLRAATALQHARLEATTVSKALLSDNVSLHDYGLYLLKMESITQYCEEHIFPLLKTIVPDIEERRKHSLIQNDLARLSFHLPLNHCYQPLKNNISIPFALGYMYVIEGSTLGGRVIAKHIMSKLNINANNGGSFFECYGSMTGKAWKNFLHSVALYEEQTNSGTAIIEGAQHAFTSIYKYFELAAI